MVHTMLIKKYFFEGCHLKDIMVKLVCPLHYYNNMLDRQ
jgi:hypothetical protein